MREVHNTPKDINWERSNPLYQQSDPVEKKQEEPTQGILPFDDNKKQFNVIFLQNPTNIGRFLLSVFHELIYGLLKVIAFVTPTGKDKIKFTAQAYYAIHISPLDEKINEAWAKSIFESQLLCTVRNIGGKEVANKENYYAAAEKVINKFLNNPATEKLLSSKSLDNLKSGTVKPPTTEGICYAEAIHFIEKFLKGDKSRANVISIGKEYEKGAPLETVALAAVCDFICGINLNAAVKPKNLLIQLAVGKLCFNGKEHKNQDKSFAFLDNIDFDLVWSIYNKIPRLNVYQQANGLALIEEFCRSQRETALKGVPPEKQEAKRNAVNVIRIILEFVNDGLDEKGLKGKPLGELFYSFYNAEIVNAIENLAAHSSDLEVPENNSNIQRLIGHFGLYSSTAEHLRNFNQLPEGAYFLGFANGESSHAIAFVKNGNNGYLFDPNYGLIDCGDNHAKSLLKLLNLYAEPTINLLSTDNKDKNEWPNYHLEITPYELEKQNSSAVAG
jgi:hypothetical protein